MLVPRGRHGNSSKPAHDAKKLVDPHYVAERLGVTSKTVHSMKQQGRMPPAIRVGGTLTRWRMDVIESWIDAGCPSVSEGDQ